MVLVDSNLKKVVESRKFLKWLPARRIKIFYYHELSVGKNFQSSLFFRHLKTFSTLIISMFGPSADLARCP